MLVAADGTRVQFGPGAEEIEFDAAGDLWGVFESGSKKYQQKGRPHVPMLAKFDTDTLLSRTGGGCNW
jgi:hypothetical protein